MSCPCSLSTLYECLDSFHQSRPALAVALAGARQRGQTSVRDFQIGTGRRGIQLPAHHRWVGLVGVPVGEPGVSENPRAIDFDNFAPMIEDFGARLFPRG